MYADCVIERQLHVSDELVNPLTERQHILGQYRFRELPLVLDRERDGGRRDRLSFRHRHRVLHSLFIQGTGVGRR